jgi:hypothetical protein
MKADEGLEAGLTSFRPQGTPEILQILVESGKHVFTRLKTPIFQASARTRAILAVICCKCALVEQPSSWEMTVFL